MKAAITWGKQKIKYNMINNVVNNIILPLQSCNSKIYKHVKFPYTCTSNINISKVKEICQFPSLFSDSKRQITFEKAGSTHS